MVMSPQSLCPFTQNIGYVTTAHCRFDLNLVVICPQVMDGHVALNHDHVALSLGPVAINLYHFTASHGHTDLNLGHVAQSHRHVAQCFGYLWSNFIFL